MTDNFERWPLPEGWLDVLRDQQITAPSPVQKAAFPFVKDGKDCFIRSQTGSGKTLAYLLPLMLNIDKELKNPQVLILVPTRELASQITQVIRDLSPATGFKAGSLIGGTSIQRQIDKLKEHPQFVVGTPGRVAELIEMKKLKMHQVRTIVIEEADQMLSLDLAPVLDGVITSTMRDRQLLFVSATLDEATGAYAAKWCDSLKHIEIEQGEDIPAATRHLFIQTEQRDKVNDLRKILRMLEPSKAIIFTGATNKVGEIVEKLKFHRLSVDAIYGDQEQKERAEIIRKFRAGQFPLLVTTDLGSRGLDFENVELVIQLDAPEHEEQYIHRAGRTGRMGKEGTVITFVNAWERNAFDKMTQKAGVTVSEKVMSEGKLVDPGQRKRSDARRPARKPQQKKEEPKKKTDRHRDRKNKGAPKWLKDKSEHRS
ncbi:DEAD/DEAH box helicase [Marinicrinis lubricantis]